MFAIAIVVPHKKALEELAGSKGIEADFKKICNSNIIRTEVVSCLNKIGK